MPPHIANRKVCVERLYQEFFGLFADCWGDDEEGSSAQLRDCSKSNCVMNFFPTTLAHFFEIFNHRQEITTLKY